MNQWIRILIAMIGLVVIGAYVVYYQDGTHGQCVPSIGGRC